MMKTRSRLWVLIASLVAGAWLLASCGNGLSALLVMADLAQLDLGWADARPLATRDSISYQHAGEARLADLYATADEGRAGLVLVPGAARDGRRDARLVEFATTLARSGFVVLVPDIPSMRELRPEPAAVAEIAAAAEQLRAHHRLARGQPLGIGAFSVAVGPVVLAALEDGLRGRLDYLLLVGGYHDLVRTLTYLTTGHFRANGQDLQRQPNAYGKWVYALGNARRLRDDADREALVRLATARLEGSPATDRELLDGLSPAGQAVYDLITNLDPARVPELVARLPDELRMDIEALDLSRLDLAGVTGDCILVHGYDDDVIPFSESVFLAGALDHCRTHLYLLRGLQHVDRSFGLVDSWRFWRVLSTLMAQRR